MKKILTLAVMAAAGFAFAEGWDVNGYIRSGIEANTDAKDFETKEYKDGKWYGNGKSRLRLNLNYSQEEYGFKFRYECNKFGINDADSKDSDGDIKEIWFTNDNLKYVYGYGKLLDGKIIAEAGKLKDGYTQTEGKEEFSAMEGYGLRGVVIPVEGLYLSAAATTYRAEKFVSTDDEVVDGKAKAGDYKMNEKVLTLSAKYKNDAITVAGGYNFAGEAYGYFDLKTVPNLTFNVEVNYLDKDISDSKNDKGKDIANTTIWEQVGYNFAETGIPLEAGIYCGQRIVEDDNVFEFYPYLSYELNEFVTPQLEVGIIKYADKDRIDNDGDDYSTTYSITPTLKLTPCKNTTVRVYYNYDKEEKHAVGTTLKVTF